MTIDEAIKYFGSKRNLSHACGFRLPLPHLWAFRGYIPIGAQMKIEEITEGKLKSRLADAR